MLNAISLFTGAGGMDIGFEEAGFTILLANDNDIKASETYIANHPSTPFITDDIDRIMGEFRKYRDVDVVFGGPPCQGFSVIGKMDPNDERSKMIWSFLNAVEIVSPKAFVMENVKSLATIKKWTGVRDAFIQRSKDLGYGCVPIIVNASEHGVPQKRERVFFIGIKGRYDFEDKLKNYLEDQKRKAPVIRELFNDLGPAGTEKNPNTCNAKITFAVRPVMRKNPYDCLMFNGIGRPIDPDGYSRTITASMGGNMTLIVDEVFLHNRNANNWIQEYYDGLVSGRVIPEFKEAPRRLRRLTINETKRLQTFPDDYYFSGAKTNIYKQIGNAVPCEMAKSVAKALRMMLEK